MPWFKLCRTLVSLVTLNPYTSGTGTSAPPFRRLDRKRRWFVAIVLCVYCVSYVGMSRQAYMRCDECEIDGVWFATPEDGDGWRLKHYSLVAIYSPLIMIDSAIGTGRGVENEPTWDLFAVGIDHGQTCRDRCAVLLARIDCQDLLWLSIITVDDGRGG